MSKYMYACFPTFIHSTLLMAVQNIIEIGQDFTELVKYRH